MPYVINNRSGDTIVIPDNSVNQDFSVDLIGRNYENYGAVVATTTVDMLDNFAHPNTPPARSVDGQLWYDKTYKQLRVKDGTTGAWIPLGILVSATAPNNDFSQLKAGVSYFNTAENLFYVHNGTNWTEAAIPGGTVSTAGIHSGTPLGGTPASYGARIRHIFLIDDQGVSRSVLALVYQNQILYQGLTYYNNEKIIAIFSGHTDNFTAGDANSGVSGTTHNFYDQLNQTGGIGLTIRPGINVRADDQGRVNFAEISERANTSYNLNTGEFGADGANITASNVYHKNAHLISNQHDTYDLGNATTTFNDGYVTNLFLGNGTTGGIQNNGSSVVDIGTGSSPLNNAHITNVIVYGDLETQGGGNIGGADNRIENLYANNINANVVTIDGYKLPTSAGNDDDIMVLGSTGNVVFKAQPKRIGSFTSSTSSIDFTETSSTVEDAVNGVTLVTYDYDYRANVPYMRNQFGVANTANLSYNTTTGVFDITRVTPLDGYAPNDFVRVANVDQNILGEKTFAGDTSFGSDIEFTDPTAVVNYDGSLTFRVGTNEIVFNAVGGINAANDISAFSDLRLKKNLSAIPQALEKVKALTGYTYNRTDRPQDTKRYTGLIAQEVQQVLPEAVSTDESRDDGMLAVAYGNMVGLLVEAVKELSGTVEELQAKVDELERSK